MAARKRPASKSRAADPRRPWDPSAPPPSQDEQDREFHATHFSADPRGNVKPGSAPGGGGGSSHKRRRGGAR